MRVVRRDLNDVVASGYLLSPLVEHDPVLVQNVGLANHCTAFGDFIPGSTGDIAGAVALFTACFPARSSAVHIEHGFTLARGRKGSHYLLDLLHHRALIRTTGAATLQERVVFRQSSSQL